jgi:hypothetical protein
MNTRERILEILNFKNVDRMPVVHFGGFWDETLQKWYEEGHLSKDEITDCLFRSEKDKSIAQKLGFEFSWYHAYESESRLFPYFKEKILEELPNGMTKVMNKFGASCLKRTGANSISAEVGHLLVDRKSWEEHFKWRLQYTAERLDMSEIKKYSGDDFQVPRGIICGSLYGEIRNWMGVEGISYLYADDEDLYDEIINTLADTCYKTNKEILKTGVKFDYVIFWEDIAFKNGPLVVPKVFEEKVGPHYKRITELFREYGVNIISVDCDGVIDSLIPIWLDNGVDTMFPIEVGTWEGNIMSWQKKYKKEIRGIGGVDKKIFALDYKAIDGEIERLKPMVEMGGYIPAPDHMITPDAKWENVQYYCEKVAGILR